MSTKSGSGFTLIEFIVAAALMWMLVAFLFTLYPTSLMALRQGEHKLMADSIARSQLENLRAMPFTRCTPGPATELGPVTGDDHVVYLPEFQVEDLGQGTYRRARVTVRWTYRGKNEEVTHATYVSKVRP